MDEEALNEAPQMPPMLDRPERPVTMSPEQAWEIYEALHGTVHVLDTSTDSISALEDKQDAALVTMESLINPS